MAELRELLVAHIGVCQCNWGSGRRMVAFSEHLIQHTLAATGRLLHNALRMILAVP